MKDKKGRQQGSIVIYAVLVMLILTAIVTLMAFMVFVSIRSATNSKNAAIAFYAAETGLEKSLYTIDKNRDSSLLSTTLSAINSAGVVTLSYARGTYTLAANNTETTTLTFDLAKGQSQQIDLFDPDDGSSLFPENTPTVNLSWTNDLLCAGSPIEFGLKEFNSSDWSAIFDQEYLVILPPTSPYNTYALEQNFNYQVKIKALQCDLTDVNFSVVNDDSTLEPFPNLLVIRSVGAKGKSSIKLEARWVWKPPLSGLGEFVLFSEEQITK